MFKKLILFLALLTIYSCAGPQGLHRNYIISHQAEEPYEEK